MRLILVGGFLGAGKTTLLGEVARRLRRRGLRAGLITNDQAPDLVDTSFLTRSMSEVREVAGSCFCCNFPGLWSAVESLAAHGAQYVVAEPVGSCTDLSATIVQPLKALHPNVSVAPLTVLVDPLRVRTALQERQPRLHADAIYILRVQLEEADYIALTKVDTLDARECSEMLAFLRREFPDTPVAALSAVSGEGVDEWLDRTLEARASGTKIAEVDYDRYAHGEAVLGWLNAAVSLRWTGGLTSDWEGFCEDLTALLRQRFAESESEIGHVKLLLETKTGYLAANLTGLREVSATRKEGALDALSAELTVNARAQTSPEALEAVFRATLREASHGRVAPSIRAFHCIQPGRPEPTYRYTSVVG